MLAAGSPKLARGDGGVNATSLAASPSVQHVMPGSGPFTRMTDDERLMTKNG